MANPLRGEAAIKDRDGNEYTLALGRVNEVAKLEAAFETEDVKTLIFGDKKSGLGPLKSITGWRTVLRIGLERYHQDKVKTDEDAGDLLDAIDIYGELAPGLMCAMTGMTREQYKQALEEGRKKSPPSKAATTS